MKKFIAMFMCAALMACVSVSAQDIYKTAANVPMVQLNNGVLMPQFGLGTFMQPSDAICKQSCLTALKAGYRHIDTAHAYNDERGVGEAVKESGIPREEIWITSKLWPTEYGEGKTLKAIDEMLARLQTDYIDLLYVHQPVGDFVGAWKDMEKAVAMGKVRALGISNFDANDEVFNKIMSESTVKPAVPPLRTTAGHAREGKALRNPHHLLVPIGRCDEQRRIVERPDNHENSRITWQDGCTGNSSLAHSRGVLGHSGRNES
nr:aldo/keto reductase [Phocaeicola massiliensis]